MGLQLTGQLLNPHFHLVSQSRVPLGPELKSSFKKWRGSIHNPRSNQVGTRWSSIIRNLILIDCLMLIQSLRPSRVQQIHHCQARLHPNSLVHRSAKPRMGNMYLRIFSSYHTSGSRDSQGDTCTLQFQRWERNARSYT